MTSYPLAPPTHTSLDATSCLYLSLCLIDADLYNCQFPQLLGALQIQQALVPPSENVLFLVNYSSAHRDVRDLITSLFAASASTGALADLQLVDHREAVHQRRNLHGLTWEERDEDNCLGSFQTLCRGPSMHGQCIRLSLHRPTKFEGLNFGVLYCLLQVVLGTVSGERRSVSFLWCPNLFVYTHCAFPNPSQLDAAMCLIHHQIC